MVAFSLRSLPRLLVIQVGVLVGLAMHRCQLEDVKAFPRGRGPHTPLFQAEATPHDGRDLRQHVTLQNFAGLPDGLEPGTVVFHGWAIQG